MSSLSNVIELSARSKQDKPFLIIHDKNEDIAVIKVTYAQVLEKVKCLKTQVSASSVSPGPVIGIWFKDDGGQLTFVKLAVAILTAIDLKTPFIVFDPESQALPWIEESLTELKIQTLFSCNDHVGCCAQFHKISGILDLYYKPGCEKKWSAFAIQGRSLHSSNIWHHVCRNWPEGQAKDCAGYTRVLSSQPERFPKTLF